MPALGPLITTRFDAASTADDVVGGVDLSGVRTIVTGASSGIGLETARSLARAGAEVTLAVRNTSAGLKAARDIAQSTGRSGVHVAALDLADRAAVDSFVQNWNGPLHLLINNAGVITPGLARTTEGWEVQFRHQLPRALRPESRTARCPRRRRRRTGRGAHRLAYLRGAHALTGRVRRHPVRAP